MESAPPWSKNTFFQPKKPHKKILLFAPPRPNGTPRRNPSHQRQHHRRVHRHRLLQLSLRRQQINRAAAVIVPREQPFFLQIGDVLVHRSQRTQPHAFLDLFKRGRVLLLRHKARNEVIQLVLTPSDRHAGSIGECKANVKIKQRLLSYHIRNVPWFWFYAAPEKRARALSEMSVPCFPPGFSS